MVGFYLNIILISESCHFLLRLLESYMTTHVHYKGLLCMATTEYCPSHPKEQDNSSLTHQVDLLKTERHGNLFPYSLGERHGGSWMTSTKEVRKLREMSILRWTHRKARALCDYEHFIYIQGWIFNLQLPYVERKLFKSKTLQEQFS